MVILTGEKSKKLLMIVLAVLTAAYITGFPDKEPVIALSASEQNLYNEIDQVVKQVLEPGGNKKFNGILVVAKDSRILYKYANGYADIKNKRQIDTKTNFNLASLSKQFTAAAIMLLYDQGRLELDDKITKYIPELAWDEVTIRHLLTHTGQIPDYYQYSITEWNDTSKPITNDDIINWITVGRLKPFSTPGSYFSYGNTGYILLASVVERVSGQDFDRFMKENVFAPLQMTSSLVFDMKKNQSIKNRAYGYKNRNSLSLNDMTYQDALLGPGGVYSNVEDLLKWDAALKTERLLKKSTIDRMYTPYTLNNGEKIRYGFGWFTEDNGKGKTVWHEGSWVGFRTKMLRNLSNGYTLIFMTNVSDESPYEAVNKIVEKIKYISE